MPTNARRQEPATARMRSLLRRLGEAGFPERFVRDVALPDWWDDEAAGNGSGYTHALMLVSRHLGVDLASMQDEARPVGLNLSAPCKFKKRADKGEDDLVVVRAMAAQVARLAAAATEEAARPLPASAADVRQQILGEGHPWVSFGVLLDHCWSVGVPVVHLSRFPKGARRPDGMSALVGGRPAIILSARRKSPAWTLFVLAHELGHVALGHVSAGGLLIDEKVADDEEDADAEERAANDFASTLLTGKPRPAYRTADRWPNAGRLAELARVTGRRDRIDPGHVALNYAHTMGADFFPVANAALRLIEPGADAVTVLRERMAARLDWSALPEDSSAFLMRVTEAKDPAENEPARTDD